MKEFWLGVNYWAAHAETDMWIRWDAQTVEKDLRALFDQGVRVMRVFPNWRDFQPVAELFSGGHRFREYRMTDDSMPENPFYLSEELLRHFHEFCSIAEKTGLKLIVGLVTGWMSGRLFIPPALYGKNVFTDPAALYLQQLYVSGFVSRMKDEAAVLAWDLGNECNCMDDAGSRQAAAAWTAMITNAIRVQDPVRPVVSGMHSLTPDGFWALQDQEFYTDILTTHPYPYWIEHADAAPQDAYRTLMHATAQTQLYADIGGKPCLVEETGTMGPMICSDEIAAGFLRVNLWSAWAHGAPGLLWWCAFDQDQLTQPPYDWNMVERELGLLHRQDQPKAMARELGSFHAALEKLNIDLPEAERDGVCLLTWGQDQVGIGYTSWVLAKRAGLTLRFAYCDQPLPDSNLYFLPSVNRGVMSKRSYDLLKQKVAEGAVLYISLNNGILSEFEELTGWKVLRSNRREADETYRLNGAEMRCHKHYCFEMESAGGEAVLSDDRGNLLLGKHTYGKGTVWTLNFPLEKNLLDEASDAAFRSALIYQQVAQDVLSAKAVTVSNPYVGLTLHPAADGSIYAVLINYTADMQKTGISFSADRGTPEALYGDMDTLGPFDSVVIRC